VTILLTISSPSSAYHKRFCNDRPIQFIFSWSFSLFAATLAHTSQNLKRSCIMLYAKPLGTPWFSCYTVCLYPPVNLNQLLHPLHSCFYHNINKATWLCIICDFRTSLREYFDPVVKRFKRQTLPTVKRKNFFMNILCIVSFCPQKKPQNRTLLFGSIHSSMIAIWLLKRASEHAHEWLLPRLSWSWTVLLRSDAYGKFITSNTTVLFLFMTYLLAVPNIILQRLYIKRGHVNFVVYLLVGIKKQKIFPLYSYQN
jgi:hypothetical protein